MLPLVVGHAPPPAVGSQPAAEVVLGGLAVVGHEVRPVHRRMMLP